MGATSYRSREARLRAAYRAARPDRAGSAASGLAPDDIDPGYIASARIVHSSGITQALSPSCRAAPACPW